MQKHNNRLKYKLFILIIINHLLASSCLAIKDSSDKKLVSIIQIVEHPALNITKQGIIDELTKHAVAIDYQSAQDNNTLAIQIAQKFINTNPNVLVGIGTSATQSLMAANKHARIPIVFSSVTDPKGAKIVTNLQSPEGLITGVSNFVDPALQFDFFKNIIPNLINLGIIYNPGDPNSVILVKSMKKLALQKNLNLLFATANNSAGVVAATHKLISNTQALFINNDNTALSAFDSIIRVCNKHKIPVFCSDIDTVDRGALAALGANQYEIGTQTGQVILKILNGTQPSQIPVVFSKKVEPRINLKQATNFGIMIPKTLVK